MPSLNAYNSLQTTIKLITNLKEMKFNEADFLCEFFRNTQKFSYASGQALFYTLENSGMFNVFFALFSSSIKNYKDARIEADTLALKKGFNTLDNDGIMILDSLVSESCESLNNKNKICISKDFRGEVKSINNTSAFIVKGNADIDCVNLSNSGNFLLDIKDGGIQSRNVINSGNFVSPILVIQKGAGGTDFLNTGSCSISKMILNNESRIENNGELELSIFVGMAERFINRNKLKLLGEAGSAWEFGTTPEFMASKDHGRKVKARRFENSGTIHSKIFTTWRGPLQGRIESLDCIDFLPGITSLPELRGLVSRLAANNGITIICKDQDWLIDGELNFLGKVLFITKSLTVRAPMKGNNLSLIVHGNFLNTSEVGANAGLSIT